jgi:hypothetical protein
VIQASGRLRCRFWDGRDRWSALQDGARRTVHLQEQLLAQARHGCGCLGIGSLSIGCLGFGASKLPRLRDRRGATEAQIASWRVLVQAPPARSGIPLQRVNALMA